MVRSHLMSDRLVKRTETSVSKSKGRPLSLEEAVAPEPRRADSELSVFSDEFEESLFALANIGIAESIAELREKGIAVYGTEAPAHELDIAASPSPSR